MRSVGKCLYSFLGRRAGLQANAQETDPAAGGQIPRRRSDEVNREGKYLESGDDE